MDYAILPKWIGSNACGLAGNLPEVLQLGAPCSGAQAVNMGLVVLALMTIGLTVRLIAIHRQAYREGHYV
jgi:hypothetical protein